MLLRFRTKVYYLFIFGGEEIIIGREERDGMLIYPQQIEEGPDGNIYVYDLADAFIKVYSPEGKFLRKIEEKRQGLGEIQRPGDASFGFTLDEKLFFTEFFGGHPWITFMELSGEFHKVLKPEQKSNYRLLDENGKKVAEIRIELLALEISKHFIFYRTTDEEENILFHCFKRKGTEKEDLLRLEKK